jgi:two-component system, NarL family, response regulator LiaR
MREMPAHSGQTIQVMLVDDHAMVRAGIKILLEQFDGIDVVGEASNGFQAIELVKQHRPDVILMDLSMPGMDGIEAIQRILALRPEQHIIVLTGFLDEERLIQAIRAGAQGCLDKTIPPEELVQSIRDVSSGKPALSSGIAWRVLRGMTGNETRQQKNKLSEREIQILRLMTQGKLDDEIAQELVLTEVTIRTHISRILTKLSLKNRVQAALFGLRSGLVSLSETSEVLDARCRPFPAVISVRRKHAAHQPKPTF